MQQAFTWANVDSHLCRHMVLLGHNDKRCILFPILFEVYIDKLPLKLKNKSNTLLDAELETDL